MPTGRRFGGLSVGGEMGLQTIGCYRLLVCFDYGFQLLSVCACRKIRYAVKRNGVRMVVQVHAVGIGNDGRLFCVIFSKRLFFRNFVVCKAGFPAAFSV